jgi:hypothetical protein
MDEDDRLLELELRGRLHTILDAHDVRSSALRDAMTDDVERALALYDHALAQPRLSNPIGWTIARFQAGDDPRARAARLREIQGSRLPAREPATLEPIVYERTEGGWHVPDAERARWNAGARD